VSTAAVSAAAVATRVRDVKAACVSIVEAAVGGAREAVMKAPVEMAEIVGPSGVETAIVAAAIVTTAIVATVHRFDRTAACQCQTRNDQASNDPLATIRRGPPMAQAPARGCENRFKKRSLHH
jgi:acyl-coenzyme A synthetase/AMP-(fatty) acid ligase